MKSVQKVNKSYRHDEEQIDFYATINADGTPHITMLTSLHIYDDDTLIWGEYSAGRSKQNQAVRPQVGFLSVIDGKLAVYGKADWEKSQKSGEMLDALNQIPEFRYNNVNGYSPAHVLHKKSMREQVLDNERYYKAKENTLSILGDEGKADITQAISVLTKQYMEAEKGFKVMAYIGEDGYPEMLPLPQAMLTSGNRVAFCMEAEEARNIPEGGAVAIYAIEYPSMCSVLLNGPLNKKQIDGQTCGYVDVETVYNPMLPVAGIIYPPQQIPVVTEFENTLYEYNV